MSQKKLCKILGIRHNVSHKFDLDNTLKNLYKYKRHLSIKEIKYINKHLVFGISDEKEFNLYCRFFST